MKKNATIERGLEKGANEKVQIGTSRLILINHPSRIAEARLDDAHLRNIAKDCHPDYVSPFHKIVDC